MVKDEFIVCPLVFYSWEVEFLLDHFVSFANDAFAQGCYISWVFERVLTSIASIG